MAFTMECQGFAAKGERAAKVAGTRQRILSAEGIKSASDLLEKQICCKFVSFFRRSLAKRVSIEIDYEEDMFFEFGGHIDFGFLYRKIE